jgi:hypothetical protein
VFAGQRCGVRFLSPPDDSRIMMRWWWFGPAVTDEELARELEVMKAGGIGGVEVQPVYPLRSMRWDPHGDVSLRCVSEALRAASDKAAALGLRFDLTLGSGWPYGGRRWPEPGGGPDSDARVPPLPAGSARVQAPGSSAAKTGSRSRRQRDTTPLPTRPAAPVERARSMAGSICLAAPTNWREVLCFIAAPLASR